MGKNSGTTPKMKSSARGQVKFTTDLNAQSHPNQERSLQELMNDCENFLDDMDTNNKRVLVNQAKRKAMDDYDDESDDEYMQGDGDGDGEEDYVCDDDSDDSH